MRPHPEHRATEDEPARIIYLGDVRRRKLGRQRKQPDSHYLAAFALVAAVAWVVWLNVVFSLHPSRLLSYLAFFVPFSVAVAMTGSIAVHVIETRAGRFPGLRQSARRGALISGVIVANMAILAAGRWSVLVLGISTLAALSIEVGITRRVT